MEALKITPDTYDIYLALPAVSHHPLQMINDCFIVREKNAAPTDWNWFEERDFHKWFKWVEAPSEDKFSDVITVPEAWDE
jgi:hypothetical protein